MIIDREIQMETIYLSSLTFFLKLLSNTKNEFSQKSQFSQKLGFEKWLFAESQNYRAILQSTFILKNFAENSDLILFIGQSLASWRDLIIQWFVERYTSAPCACHSIYLSPSLDIKSLHLWLKMFCTRLRFTHRFYATTQYIDLWDFSY